MADNDILGGFQAGLQMSQQRLSNSLRMQELQSMEAVRRQQERESAARMRVLLEKHKLDIDRQATLAKRTAQFITMIAPTIPGPTGLPMPNPMRVPVGTAGMLNFLDLAESPEHAATMMAQFGLANEREREAQQAGQPATIETITTPSGRNLEVFNPGVGRGSRQLITPGPEVITDDEGNQFYQSGPNKFTRVPPDPAVRQREARTHAFQASQLEFLEKNAPVAWAKVLQDAPRDPVTKLPIPTPEAIDAAAKVAGFEPGTKAKMEEQMVAAEDLFSTAREFLPLITKQNVGIRGAIQRWGARLGMGGKPGFENANDAQKAATMSRVFMASIFRTLRSDSNIAKPEVEALEAAAPDTTRFIDDPDSIKSQMAALLRNANNKDRNAAARMGKPVSNFFLTQPELEARIANGSLTPQQAADIYNRSAAALITALEASPQ